MAIRIMKWVNDWLIVPLILSALVGTVMSFFLKILFGKYVNIFDSYLHGWVICTLGIFFIFGMQDVHKNRQSHHDNVD